MITVYTCIAGNYDVLVPQPKFPNVDYVCFAETERPYKYKNWSVVPFISPKDLKNSPLINRFHKILCFNEFDHGNFSIYIDGNVKLETNPQDFVKILKKNNLTIGAFKHPQRNSIFEEFEACLEQKKISEDEIRRAQELFLEMKKEGYEQKGNLTANYILVRKKDDKQLVSAMQDWWEIVLNKIGRDQLSMQYVLWKNDIEVLEMDDFLVPSKTFSQIPHGRYSRILPIIIQSTIKKIFIKAKLLSKGLYRKIKKIHS